MEVKDYAIQCFKDEAAAVLGLIDKLDDKFEQAVQLFFKALRGNGKRKLLIRFIGSSDMVVHQSQQAVFDRTPKLPAAGCCK